MKPLYWILIIAGVAAAGVATTIILVKRKKSDENEEEAEDASRRSLHFCGPDSNGDYYWTTRPCSDVTKKN